MVATVQLTVLHMSVTLWEQKWPKEIPKNENNFFFNIFFKSKFS